MHRKFLSVFFMIAVLFLSSCSKAAAPASTSASSSGNTITVDATDNMYTPVTWKVKAGQQVSVSLKNDGDTEHEWVLIKQGQTVTPPFSDDDEDKVFWEIEAEEGETNTGTFTAPSQPGTYTVVCGIPGHLESGMVGTLVIE